jgi:hypothetical protein
MTIRQVLDLLDGQIGEHKAAAKRHTRQAQALGQVRDAIREQAVERLRTNTEPTQEKRRAA